MKVIHTIHLNLNEIDSRKNLFFLTVSSTERSIYNNIFLIIYFSNSICFNDYEVWIIENRRRSVFLLFFFLEKIQSNKDNNKVQNLAI